MTTQSRKERERAQRHQLIITTARNLAEADGWDAVTTRRLSESIEYSQPVLYSHFTGKRAIMDAVAIEGSGEFARLLRAARDKNSTARQAVVAVVEVYMDFGRHNPATFDAMFTADTDLPFGTEAPQPLRDAFGELYAVFAPLAGDRDPLVFTEVAWSAIHGLTVLERNGRLPFKDTERRISILVGQLLVPPGTNV